MSRMSTIIPYYGSRRPPVGARRVRMVRTAITKIPRSFPSRLRGTISRGYTRRAGFYGRYNMGNDGPGELKFFDITVDDIAIAAAGAIFGGLNQISQGVGESQRIGRKCTIRSIEWKARYTLPEIDALASPQDTAIVRMILYQDQQANGAAATVVEILKTASALSFYNLQNQGRFKILLDRTFAMNSFTNYSDGDGLSSAPKVEKFFS